MNLENKKRYILSIIVAVLVVISLGTYAWLTYRTNDTAMILTIGDINNVRITMNPYQIDANLSPNLTYTGQPYTTVEVVNNSSEPKGIKLYYTINAIDSELATSNLKYTIEKKAVGSSSYTHITPDGNFAGATKGDIITIVDEEVPVGTTYYKVYVWLYSASSAQNNVTGKRFNAELGADIKYHVYTVNLYNENATNYNSVIIGSQISNTITQYPTASSAMANFSNRPFYLKHTVGNFSGWCIVMNGDTTNCLYSAQNESECNTVLSQGAPNDGNTYTCSNITASNTVTESYVGFVVTESMASANPGMTAGTYYLKGGDGGASYSSNVSTLTTAFGASNCTDNSSGFGCDVSDLGARADVDGYVVVATLSAPSHVHGVRGAVGNSDCHE